MSADEETKVRCPTCNGRGVQGRLADWKDPKSETGMFGGWVEMKCDFCKGEGWVTPSYLAMREDWKRRGKECREKRLGYPRSVVNWFVIAKEMGVGIAPVSQMECGSIDPTPLEKWWSQQGATP